MDLRGRLDVHLRNYYILFRLKSVFIYIFPLTLGFAAAADGGGTLSGYKIAFMYLGFLCGSMFSSTLNFYVDAPADRLHNDMYKDQPISNQPFATGEMGNVETTLLFLFTGAGCIFFSFLVNLQFALYMLGSVFILGILYSHPWFRFKAKPVLDIATNAVGACVLLITGWKAVDPATWPPIWPLVFGFLFSAILYMPSMANDVPFDEAVGFRTSGVVFGAKRILDAMIPLCVILVPVAVTNFVVDQSWLFKLFIAMALPGAIVFTIGMRLLYRPPHIRFNTALLVYPLAALLLFYFVYGVHAIIT
ncbi:MAG: UbiA family prenyltransferase [Actinomycetota bacterium]|nr:UbiA family prenyltransferase [Actinomycetota bacterium]